MEQAEAISPPKKRPSSHFTVEDKVRILNIFKVYAEEHPENPKTLNVEFTAKAASVSVTSVFKLLREYKGTHEFHSPKIYYRKRGILDSIDDETKSAMRRLIHSFFESNEPLTLDKILAAVNEFELLQYFKRSTLRTLMKEIGCFY